MKKSLKLFGLLAAVVVMTSPVPRSNASVSRMDASETVVALGQVKSNPIGVNCSIDQALKEIDQEASSGPSKEGSAGVAK